MVATLERIVTLMKQQNMPNKDMIACIGLRCGTFSNWRRGKGRSYYEHIDVIADCFGVTIDYLIRGREIKTASLADREAELVENYRKLSPEGKNAVNTVAILPATKR